MILLREPNGATHEKFTGFSNLFHHITDKEKGMMSHLKWKGPDSKDIIMLSWTCFAHGGNATCHK